MFPFPIEDGAVTDGWYFAGTEDDFVAFDVSQSWQATTYYRAGERITEDGRVFAWYPNYDRISGSSTPNFAGTAEGAYASDSGGYWFALAGDFDPSVLPGWQADYDYTFSYDDVVYIVVDGNVYCAEQYPDDLTGSSQPTFPDADFRQETLVAPGTTPVLAIPYAPTTLAVAVAANRQWADSALSSPTDFEEDIPAAGTVLLTYGSGALTYVFEYTKVPDTFTINARIGHWSDFTLDAEVGYANPKAFFEVDAFVAPAFWLDAIISLRSKGRLSLNAQVGPAPRFKVDAFVQPYFRLDAHFILPTTTSGFSASSWVKSGVT